MYSKEELLAKSKLELNAIGKSEFDLSLDPDKQSADSMAELILAAQAADIKPARAKGAKPKAEVEAEAESKPKQYRIVISNQEGDDDTPFVVGGVNGTAYQIPRETEVVVSEEILESLQNAKLTRMVQEGSRQVLKDMRRFPISILGVVE